MGTGVGGGVRKRLMMMPNLKNIVGEEKFQFLNHRPSPTPAVLYERASCLEAL